MTIGRLVFREIRFRALNFGLGVMAATIAVACVVGAFALLRSFDLRTEFLLAQRENDVKLRMQEMEDDYRKITLGLGFNILILPRDQNLGDLWAEDYAAKLMPESYVNRLTGANVMTIAHVLPILQQKVRWPEQQRTMILTGTYGEVSLPGQSSKRPLLDTVKPGTIVLGYELHQGLRLKPGDQTRLFGKTFTVARCNPERGSKDDITAWVHLREAQALLSKQGQINGIFALSCRCEGDQLALIRGEVSRILPDTQVVEFASQAVARAEARSKAAATAQASLDAEKQGRADLRRERESLAAILVPLVLLACMLWIGLLAFGNVHERRSEIGILRALGVSGRQVLSLFLVRAAITGGLGAVLGCAAGSLVGAAAGGAGRHWASALDPRSLLVVALLAPALSLIASYVPAAMAAQQDPAAVLGEE